MLIVFPSSQVLLLNCRVATPAEAFDRDDTVMHLLAYRTDIMRWLTRERKEFAGEKTEKNIFGVYLALPSEI